MKRKGLLAILLILLLALTWIWRKGVPSHQANENLHSISFPSGEIVWTGPDTASIPMNETGEIIRYGRKLIRETAVYFGPKGRISPGSNGMNCQNCHLKAGTQAWAGNFSTVASTYPRFSDRKGSFETINQRIADCFERSLNGIAPDSNSREIKAMKAYICWVGKDVEKGKKPRGTGMETLPFLERAADPEKGKAIYTLKCRSCHGTNGEGQPDSAVGFKYPPLWGENSYNSSAGIFRLSKFAGFIKDNMPFGSDYANEQLSTEQAWDLAAFVNSQPRPVKKFKQDWPDIRLKPADLPNGPYLDSFSEIKHKYGPFSPIELQKKKMLSGSIN